MADGFIVRRGGVADATPPPTIKFVSKTEDSVTFTITNNSLKARDITYGLTTPPTTTTINLAGGATSSNQTISNITADVVTIFARAEDSAITEFRVRLEFVFDPADLSPQLWLDAADATTITESSGDVSQWNNKGSLGNFTQGTGSLQPKTGVTTLNSLNVIDFNSDRLVSTNTNEWKFMHDGTKYELFSVVKFGTSSNPNAFYTLIGNDGGNSANHGFRLFYDDRSGSSKNDVINFGVSRGVGGAFAVLNETANDYYTPNQFAILSVYADPSNATAADRSEIRTNGNSLVKNNTSTNAVSTSNPSTALVIGAFADGGLPLVGSIAEMIVISGANVTSGNRTDIINYLADKWGITI